MIMKSATIHYTVFFLASNNTYCRIKIYFLYVYDKSNNDEKSWKMADGFFMIKFKLGVLYNLRYVYILIIVIQRYRHKSMAPICIQNALHYQKPLIM